jgi:hypothetical protein
MPANEEAFIRQLRAFVAYHGIRGTVYGKERKESVCDFALAHLMSEDTEMMNGEFDEAIWKLCGAYGWAMDRGYHWSWHFWPADHPPAQIKVINADIPRPASRPLAPGECPF